MNKTATLFLIASMLLQGAFSENCIDLTPFVRNPNELEALKGGGSVYKYAPVFFDVPSQFVSGETIYCLEDLAIPTQVGENDCEEMGNCFLAVGLHAGDHNDLATTDSCTSADGDTNNCYACACTGASLSSATVDMAQPNGCGLVTDSRWGVSCPDVANGRYEILNGTERIKSNYSNVQVVLCPDTASYCDVCSAGMHPSFTVGVQWISDLDAQCFDRPFEDEIHIAICGYGYYGAGDPRSFVFLGLLLGLILCCVFCAGFAIRRCCCRRAESDEAGAIEEEHGGTKEDPDALSLDEQTCSDTTEERGEDSLYTIE